MFCVNLIIILLYTLSILGDTEMSNTMFLLLISSQKKMYGLSLEGLTIAFKFLYNVNLEHVIKKRICFTFLTAVSTNRLMFFFFLCVSLLREVHHTYLFISEVNVSNFSIPACQVNFVWTDSIQGSVICP